MRRRFKCDPKWITVRYPARCAEPNCQTQIKQGERAFYYPSRSSRLRLKLRSRREGRTRFYRTPNRRRRLLSQNQGTKNGGSYHVSQQSNRNRKSWRDPEVRALPSGQNVANFSLATTAQFKDRNGEQQKRTEWHRVVAFGKLADTCQQFLTKGRQVYVEGRLTTRQYEAKDGSGKREPHRDRSASDAHARQSRERQRAQSGNDRRHPVLTHLNRERAAKAALSLLPQYSIGDYDNGHLCNRYREDNQSA